MADHAVVAEDISGAVGVVEDQRSQRVRAVDRDRNELRRDVCRNAVSERGARASRIAGRLSRIPLGCFAEITVAVEIPLSGIRGCCHDQIDFAVGHDAKCIHQTRSRVRTQLKLRIRRRAARKRIQLVRAGLRRTGKVNNVRPGDR